MDNVAKYLSILKNTRASLVSSTCGACGSKTFIKNNDTHCNFCELIAMSKADASYNLQAFKNISTLIDKEKIDDALLSLQEVSKNNLQDPTSAYICGILYEFISNYRYHGTNYSRLGFMEENSANIYSSLDMISKSKEHLFKALKLITKLNQKDDNMLYLEFMANIKLRRVSYAINLLKKTTEAKISTPSYSYMYMVHSALLKIGDAETRSASMISTGELNAFYYLSISLAGKKNIDGAISILTELTNFSRMPMAFYLLKKLSNISDAREI